MKFFLLCFFFCLGTNAGVCRGQESNRSAVETNHRLRDERRVKMRALVLNADKNNLSVEFGLLVIPVDFQDQRFPEPFDRPGLASRIFGPEPENLYAYYHTAANGKMDLHSVVTPVVHLPGDQADYSDIGWHGFSRTRALARQALTAVRDMGYTFGALDMDGPDGMPDSGDDDGFLDGVLILHSGTGQELDPENGLIQALQFFLAEPVFAGGIGASFYAVASMSSGLGIWAHETGHLMGMEDRYDLTLAPAGQSEVVSRGGLGIFSLMSAGAWGSGSGQGAALPDAYTLQEMGWLKIQELDLSSNIPVSLTPVSTDGLVMKLPVRGTGGREYFLLSTRDPVSAFPFDARMPGQQLLVYHVDESLPEGQSEPDLIAGRHLRVSLVEADGNSSLLEGLDGGSAADLFPGTLLRDNLPAYGNPGLGAYGGQTGVSLQGITSNPKGVEFALLTTLPTKLQFNFTLNPDLSALELLAWTSGTPVADLHCTLSVADSSAGLFPDGTQIFRVDLPLGDDGFYRPELEIPWVPNLPVTEGSSTIFHFLFEADQALDYDSLRTWEWGDHRGTLDFGGIWPGTWTISHPEGNTETTWQRWANANALLANGGAVLACTGSSYVNDDLWPDVKYGNQAHTLLTSSVLGPEVQGVRMVYALESEMLQGDIALDGGRLVWLGADGIRVAAEPLTGMPGYLSPQSSNALQGFDVFARDSLSFRDDHLVWSVAVAPVPQEGVGPWRLELEFGSNGLWRRRGWFVAALTPLIAPSELIPFAVTQPVNDLGQQRVAWRWPWPESPPAQWVVQVYNPEHKTWLDATTLPVADANGILVSDFQRSLGVSSPWERFRILGFSPLGWTATREFFLSSSALSSGKVILGLPWPNPGLTPIQVLTDLSVGEQGWLRVYDLKGARLRSLFVPGGTQVMAWDGFDERGNRVPAGLYFFRLEGIPGSATRKVVLLR